MSCPVVVAGSPAVVGEDVPGSLAFVGLKKAKMLLC